MFISKENKNELTLEEYKQLFDRLYPQLCVFAYKYLNDLEFSKGLVQEVFVKLWEDEIVFQSESHATGVFYKVVKNTSINYLKSKT